MNWEKLFEKETLDAGYDDYCYNLVKGLGYNGEFIKAVVCGAEDYVVEIATEGDEVTRMSCSCSAAKARRNCRHMAAVLYEWSDIVSHGAAVETRDDSSEGNSGSAFTVGNVPVEEIPAEEVAEAVHLASERQLRAFLADILCKDPRLFLQFKVSVSQKLSPKDMERYKNQVEAAVRAHLDRGDFISYHRVFDFISAMENYLNEDVREMIATEDYRSAFELSAHLYTEVDQVNMEDPGGLADMFAEKCAKIWRSILDHADIQTKRFILEWIVTNADEERLASSPMFARFVDMYQEEKMIDRWMESGVVRRNWRFQKEK